MSGLCIGEWNCCYPGVFCGRGQNQSARCQAYSKYLGNGSFHVLLFPPGSLFEVCKNSLFGSNKTLMSLYCQHVSTRLKLCESQGSWIPPKLRDGACGS